MAEARRRHGRWFDLLATVLIGLVVTGAALIPAATANSGEQTTIRGDVSVDGQRMAFFPVGFWVPGTGALMTGSTDANGVFTLEVPVARDGYVYAGALPDAERTITTSEGMEVVRGTIGEKVQRPIASPLYQGWAAATARNLAGGADQLHFRLQQAGRIGGTLPIRSSQVRAVQVRRLDGSVVQSPKPDSRGRWVSMPLAPGRYAAAIVPVAPLLPVAVQVDVVAARTVRANLPAPVAGATIDGRLDAAAGASLRGVPVLLEQGDRVVASGSADASGAYRFIGVGAGEYTVEVGRYADRGTASPTPAEVRVPIPGRTSTPSPSSTPSSPAPSPAATAQAVEPVQRVSAAVQPTSTAVTVPETLGEVAVRTDVAAAGRLAGTVSGGGTDAVQVAVEDVGTGRVLQVAAADDDGRWSVGGLTPGERYTVWAVSRPDDPTQARMGTTDGLATTSTTGIDVTLDRPAATLQGTVTGATGGTVSAGSADLLSRTSTVDASGAYSVQGLVPGLLPVTVQVPNRLVSDPVAVAVTEDAGPRDLQPGPRPSTFEGWFISGGDGVPLVSGTATSTDDATVRFSSRGADGRLRVDDLRPGAYQYDAGSFAGTVPALDGPWWFEAPQGSFTLNDGMVTNAGPIVLHVKAR